MQLWPQAINPALRDLMSSPSDNSKRFVHRLLRARDWQDRPQFREVCDWWSAGGSGVLALVGIGGSGKTAIAERFLQVVPGGYPANPKAPKNADLPELGRVFVFSFYDAPNPDSFVSELGHWLSARDSEDDEELPSLSYHQVLQLLPSAGRCLLILDGLEKVQDDGSRGGAFGQINDGRLRDFVLRVSDALVPDVSLLITSRFRLYDPLAHRTDCYRQVDVEQLEPDAAVKLLRDRGVEKGTRRQLEDVAREQGFHALSVDLTGGYIARFCKGDATQLPAFESLDLSDLDPHLNPADRAIAEQERRFIRLAERYEEVLAESDPAALALLQRVCLFRLGIDVDTVAAIFTGRGKSKISGRALSKLKKSGVRSKLKLLASMGLVEASATRADEPEERTVYTIHPAVRDGFRSSLDRETALASHDAAREGLEASLGEQPAGEEYPSDTETLDLLEEIIYHTLSSFHVGKAWEIYKSRIGRHINLGWRLGQFDRGERICRAFEIFTVIGLLDERDWRRQFGFFLTHLGDLTHAGAVFSGIPDYVNLASGFPNRASVSIVRGHLMGVDSFVQASSAVNEEGREAYRGHISALQGQVEAALGFFVAAVPKDDEFLSGDSGIWHCGFLSRLDRALTARRLTELHRDESLKLYGPADMYVPMCRLLLAELSLRRGDAEDAADELQQACDWALARDAKEVLCWSALFRGRLELARLSEHGGARSDSLQHAVVATEEGLRIARDCGYAVFHVDLLLQQARVNLLRGCVESALASVSLAVEDGLPADEVTGRPDMPAASDKRFGYAWGIVEGLHLRGEAQLLQAAGRLGSETYTPRSRKTPAEVRELIAAGKRDLEEAMERWKDLRDPDPPEDNNFVHPQTGEEYNYRAAETYDVLQALSQGVLTTRYPLQPLTDDSQPGGQSENRSEARQELRSPAENAAESLDDSRYEQETPAGRGPSFDVFVSYRTDDLAAVKSLVSELQAGGVKTWFDKEQMNLVDNVTTQLDLGLKNSRGAIVCFGSEGLGPWQQDELGALLQRRNAESRTGGRFALIPVLLPDAPVDTEQNLPSLLQDLPYIDLRGDAAPEIERLVSELAGS